MKSRSELYHRCRSLRNCKLYLVFVCLVVFFLLKLFKFSTLFLPYFLQYDMGSCLELLLSKETGVLLYVLFEGMSTTICDYLPFSLPSLSAVLIPSAKDGSETGSSGCAPFLANQPG